MVTIEGVTAACFKYSGLGFVNALHIVILFTRRTHVSTQNSKCKYASTQNERQILNSLMYPDVNNINISYQANILAAS